MLLFLLLHLPLSIMHLLLTSGFLMHSKDNRGLQRLPSLGVRLLKAPQARCFKPKHLCPERHPELLPPMNSRKSGRTIRPTRAVPVKKRENERWLVGHKLLEVILLTATPDGCRQGDAVT